MNEAFIKLANLTKEALTADYVQEIIRAIEYRVTMGDDERGYAVSLLLPPKGEPEGGCPESKYGEDPGAWKKYREEYSPTEVVLTETRELNRFAYGEREETKTPPIFNAVFPGEPNYLEKLWEAVLPAKAELAFWFGEFSENRVPYERLVEICRDIKPRVIAYSQTENIWAPNIGMVFSEKSDLRSFVLGKAIVWPFFRGEGELFQRIRRCPVCSLFFYAERLGREFCGDACRNKNFRRQKEQSKN